ncbi:MAG: dienelactone hydrolase family protein, partial [Bryobacteraceae bacterium]
DAQVISDLDSAVTFAAHSGHGDTNRLSITGFCWGGRIVWLYAAHNKNLKAGVAWYGRLAEKGTALQPKFPIDVAGSVKAPVLGLYGAEDSGIPLSAVEKMRSALTSAGSPSEIVVYPGVGHAFHADYRSTYRQQPAEDGWQRLQAWFKRWV